MHTNAQPDQRKTLLDKCIKDRTGKLVLWQKPNLPIIVWAVARLLQWPLNGQPAHIAGLVADAALLVWALLELVQGVNYARRLLGAIVLAVVVYGLFR